MKVLEQGPAVVLFVVTKVSEIDGACDRSHYFAQPGAVPVSVFAVSEEGQEFVFVADSDYHSFQSYSRVHDSQRRRNRPKAALDGAFDYTVTAMNVALSHS